MDLAGFSFSPTLYPGEAAVNLLMTYLFIYLFLNLRLKVSYCILPAEGAMITWLKDLG